MTSLLHNDPIIYRAYGTVRGTYKPSKTDPYTGTLITDDGTKFTATISYEVATLLEHNPQKLSQQALWKCYFRTRPSSLYLRKVKTENVEKNRQHSFRVNKFQVDGKILKINKESVSVQIQPNTGDGEPYTLTLKGSFSGDKSWPFWRFKLRREGKSYVIQKLIKLPLPPVEKAPPPPPPPKKEKKTTLTPQRKQQQKQKAKDNTPAIPPSLYKKKEKKITPTSTTQPTEAEIKKRVFNLVDKFKK